MQELRVLVQAFIQTVFLNGINFGINAIQNSRLFQKDNSLTQSPLTPPSLQCSRPKGLAILTQLLVGPSKLNLHKFKHNFNDTVNPMCPINLGLEYKEHFLLLCCRYEEQRSV